VQTKGLMKQPRKSTVAVPKTEVLEQPLLLLKKTEGNLVTLVNGRCYLKKGNFPEQAPEK
jgi:hypothetical protein